MTAITARRVPVHVLILTGGTSAILGVGALLLAAQMHSLTWFLIAATAWGVCYSGTFLGGLTLVANLAPAEQRGAVTSAVYLLAYVAQGALALALGVIATSRNLHIAVVAGSSVIVLSALGVILAAVPMWPRAT